MKKLNSLICALLLSSYTTLTFGACNLSMILSGTNLINNNLRYLGNTEGYSPYATISSERINIRFQNAGDKTCQYFITATGGLNSPDYINRTARNNETKETLRYQIYKTNTIDERIIRDLPNQNFTSSSRPYSHGGNVGARKQSTQSIYFRVPSGQEVPAGVFVDEFVLDLYDHDILKASPHSVPVQRITVRLEIRVRPIIFMDLISDRQSDDMTLNFGEAHVNDEVKFAVRVVSNTKFEVYFNSLNRGLLKHVTKTAQTAGMRYDIIRTNNSPVTYRFYETNPQRVVDRNASSPTGFERNFIVRLVDIPNTLFAGQYQDVIQITVEER